MRISAYLVSLALLVPTHSVRADIYRCSGASGEPLFSQQPCGADSTVAARGGGEVTGQAVGLRPSERAWLQERARGNRQRRQKGQQASISPADTKRKSEKQAYQCRQKRRSLDSLAARMRRGYKPAQGEKLRRRRAGYEDYLAAFCP